MCGTISPSHHIWDHRSMVLFLDFSEKRGRLIFFRYESTSTVDFDRFCSEIDGQCDIDRIFRKVNWHRASVLTVFPSR